MQTHAPMTREAITMKSSTTSYFMKGIAAVLLAALMLAAAGCANSATNGGDGGPAKAQGEGTATPGADANNGSDNSTNPGEDEANEPTTVEEPGSASPDPDANAEGEQPDKGAVPGGEEEPAADDGASGEAFVAENEAFRLLSPGINAQVGRAFKVKGQARVFEAAFSYTFEDGHDVLAEGHVQASQGAPEWGDFEFEVKLPESIDPTSPTGTLTLYESSAKDGSPIHQLTITVEFDPALLPAEE